MAHRRAADDGTDALGPESDDPGTDGDTRDTPAEVDAAFRTLRRSAFAYFAVFLLVVGAFPALSLTLDWWSDSRLVGNMSPGFVTAAVGLYVVFVIIAIAAATLTSAVEDRMLGGSSDAPDTIDDPHPGSQP